MDAVPDHSTISRFRKKIAERGLARALFAEVNRQLEERGMLVKRGTLIDATIIEAQARRPQSEAGERGGRGYCGRRRNAPRHSGVGRNPLGAPAP